MDKQCTLCEANTEFLSVLSEVLSLEGARDIPPFPKSPNRFLNPRNLLFSVLQRLFARRLDDGWGKVTTQQHLQRRSKNAWSCTSSHIMLSWLAHGQLYCFCVSFTCVKFSEHELI